MIPSYEHRINVLQRIACYKTTTASALSLSSAYKIPVFSEINPVTPIFFHLESFLWKGPLTAKVRKKVIDQILGYISFCIEIRAHLGHLFA